MPDLAVICNPNKLHEQYCFGAPTVVMEILFPSTVKADRLVKLNRYQQAGLTVDGQYGAGTKTAVTNFQNSVGLKADGDAGTDTIGALINDDER